MRTRNILFGGGKLPPARTKPLRHGEGPASRWSGKAFGFRLARTLAPPAFSPSCATTALEDRVSVREKRAALSIPALGTRLPNAFSAFSFIEIMVVVALLSVIVLGLMAMFNQTQRAFRLGLAQTDVLESGRMATDMIAREVEQITPSDFNRTNAAPNGAILLTPNFFALVANAYQLALPGENLCRTNIMQDVFFLIRQNQTWTGIGYFVRTNRADYPSLPGNVGPVGTLYRFETNDTVAQFEQNPGGLFAGFSYVLQQVATNNVSKVVDGVIGFRIQPFDANGWLIGDGRLILYDPSWYTNWPPCMANGNLIATNTFPASGVIGDYEFYSNAVPASVELELGVLEQQTFEQYQSIPIDAVRWNFLTNAQARAVSHMHLFRQRIAIRNVDPAAYH